jgi:AbrB family looped-hinge helix DNA binding protein
MERSARLRSKGQLTVPKLVRDALGISEGDEIVFRVDASGVSLSRGCRFLSLAGSFEVPASRRDIAWRDAILATHTLRARRVVRDPRRGPLL